MAKDTFARRNFNNGATKIRKHDDLSALPPNQLKDFQLVGLVGEKVVDDATAATPAKA